MVTIQLTTDSPDTCVRKCSLTEVSCAFPPREVLINSMHGVYAPKITNAGVDKLNNSGAITYASRLGVENFESHIHSSRVNRHLPRSRTNQRQSEQIRTNL